MAVTREVAAIARDPTWLAHRYDPEHDAVHFVKVDRNAHRGATFLIDEYLPAGTAKVVLRRDEAVTAAADVAAPIHFILHSAYCCSTLLARAFDQPGVAMGLKEPVILNDLVGWRRRGGDPRRIAQALDGALTLLARPFGPGEAVVVKPSNIVNGLGLAMLAIRPQARALLLHAPLGTYLGSIAKKGLDGRLWVRELFLGLRAENLVRLGFDDAQFFGQTDLQIAAAGWLAQQALFAELLARFGADWVRSLSSETLTARPAEVMTRLAELYRLPLDAAAVAKIVGGPVFSRHSKFDAAFDGGDRAAEHREAAAVHGDEIAKVMLWTETVAKSAGIPMTLDAPLLG